MTIFPEKFQPLWIRITVLLSSLVMTACAMGPDYKRPSIDINKQFLMAQEEGESIANLPWWEFLQDEKLQKLINQALLDNRDLKRATASIEEFQARLKIARMDFLPNININANAPFMGTMGGFARPGFPSSYSYFGQTDLNWELDIWGKIQRANEAARADLLAREENRRAVILMLISSVAQSYFDLLQFDKKRNIARRALSSWQESVAISSAQLKGGVISRLDLDQFEAERANAVARLAEFERLIVQKENELNVLIGNNPAPILRVDSLNEQKMPLKIPAGLPSELLQRRPDILQAEQTMVAATARIGMTKAMRFPSFSITGFLGLASPALSDLLLSDSKFGVGGAGLTGPVFNSNSLGFEQRAAEAQARQVLANYEQTILVAFKEVEDTLVAIRTANEQREARELQVKSLRSALHVASLRYRGGLTSYVDVLLAKRNLFEAEFSLTDTHRLHLVSIVQLYRALGGGWNLGDESN